MPPPRRPVTPTPLPPGEAHRLRADKAFLAEELCSTAQQVIEVAPFA
jgi:hypothetical protein